VSVALGPPGAQGLSQLTPQGATSLDGKRLIGAVVGDPHRGILVILHSDHGCSTPRWRLATAVGCSAYDPRAERSAIATIARSARASSQTLECDLLDRRTFRPRPGPSGDLPLHGRLVHPRRRHSALGYRSPVAFEAAHAVAGDSPVATRPRNRVNSTLRAVRTPSLIRCGHERGRADRSPHRRFGAFTTSCGTARPMITANVRDKHVFDPFAGGVELNRLDIYDPEKIPTLGEVIMELDDWHAENVGLAELALG
jgi:hypothetical protein